MPLAGSCGSAGGALPSHHALHPPVGPKDFVPSPETLQPGYSLTPLASANENLYGPCSVRMAATCASLRHWSPLAPLAQSSFEGSKCFLQPTGSSTRPSAMPSCASQAASTASCTNLTCAGRIQPSPMV